MIRPLGILLSLCIFLLVPVRLRGAELGLLLLLRSELNASRTLLAQTALSGPGVFCLLDVTRCADGATDLRGGLESAVLTAGPLQRSGLLRLLFRPLGHGPGSALFREDTDLRLDRSLQACRRTGLLLEPLPGRLGLFSFTDAGREAASGGYLRLGRSGGARLEALVLTSRPQPPEPDDRWLSFPPPYPGGRLLHLAARAGCDFTAWRLCFQAAACGGERTPPGHLVQLAAGSASERINLALACGLCSPTFLTPEGRGGQPRFRAGGRACLGDGSLLRVGGLAELLLTPSAGARDAGLRRECREELSALLKLPGGAWRLEGKILRESGGVRVDAGVARETPAGSAELSCRLDRRDRRNREDSLAVRLGGRRRELEWRAVLETCLVPAFRVKAGGAFELTGEAGRFYARLSCREWLDPAGLFAAGCAGLTAMTSFTLGWETRAEMPAGGREKP